MVKKVIKIVLILILAIVILIVGGCTVFFGIIDYQNKHYWKYAQTGGDIEAKYTAFGSYEVAYNEFDSENEAYKKYEVWYPSDMKDTEKTYPLVIMANGTGVKASQYKEVFKHLASWGFIVVGNEDENSRTGASSAATLDFILSLNEDESSDFYSKVNIENIGIAGHSQGGVGAINAVTEQENGEAYKAIFVASTTSPYWGQDDVFGSEWRYDLSKINIPCFMVAGTGSADAGTAEDISKTEGQGICPLWAMQENYWSLPDSITKVMARKIGKDHGDMLRQADGYMTAWFMWLLKGDEEAAKAFIGETPELLNNSLYQDVRISE